ncbi:MAG: 3-deoxy-7-phosphoheptulonate synthase [Kiritimatiellae bacterium]|nr:3-deoxy-7-phosphoheptulonate synthase [Kiritimatiellia bacterium]
MIIIVKNHADKGQLDTLLQWLKGQGIQPNLSVGTQQTIVGCIGDVSHVDIDLIRALDVVESVQRIQEPYKNVNRKFHPEDTVVDCSGVKVGGGAFQVMAGPCAVEDEEQLLTIARAVKAAGATMLRGGAFKPRTSPYSFQGLGAEGIKLLLKARQETGLPIVTEIMNVQHLPLFEDVDVIQVGARNMQNFELLKELGHSRKPILLKRGLANTLQELLMSAEYIMAGGNSNIMLCERGIRTFETSTRNTLDLNVVPLLHRLSHLPVVIDPSHATGHAWLVPPCAAAATAIGADALIIEVHNDPPHAMSDGVQSLTLAQFATTMAHVRQLRPLACHDR